MAKTNDFVPWTNIRHEELYESYKFTKKIVRDAENFQEKLRALKIRQDEVQQRRLDRLKKEGIVINLEYLKSRDRPKKQVALYSEEDELLTRKKSLDARKPVPKKTRLDSEAECEGIFEYESELEYDVEESKPPQCERASEKQVPESVPGCIQSRDAKLDLIKEHEVFDVTLAARSMAISERKSDKSPKRSKFKSVAKLLTATKIIGASASKTKTVHSPDRKGIQQTVHSPDRKGIRRGRSIEMITTDSRPSIPDDASSAVSKSAARGWKSPRGSLVRAGSFQTSASSSMASGRSKSFVSEKGTSAGVSKR